MLGGGVIAAVRLCARVTVPWTPGEGEGFVWQPDECGRIRERSPFIEWWTEWEEDKRRACQLNAGFGILVLAAVGGSVRVKGWEVGMGRRGSLVMQGAGRTKTSQRGLRLNCRNAWCCLGWPLVRPWRWQRPPWWTGWWLGSKYHCCWGPTDR